MIYEIRGQKILLDTDIADLYEIETFNLNKAVKRNIGRFPSDFMFQLTKEEWEDLIFQNGISSKQHGGRRFMPYAFTEQGIAMLASVLNTPKAIEVNINIMRAFVKLRHYAFSQSATNEQITELRKLLMLYIYNVNTFLRDQSYLYKRHQNEYSKRYGGIITWRQTNSFSPESSPYCCY